MGRPASSALLALLAHFALFAFLVSPLHVQAQEAQEGPGDGAYGRLDGDLMLSFGLGGGPTVGGSRDGAFIGELRARYLDMVGVFIAPEVHVGDGDPEGRLVAGLELRPLWPIRFFLNGFSGNEWLDLLVESVSAEVGVAVLPFGTGGGGVGAALALGFGLDVPILVPSVFADGLFLHLGARHVRAGAADQAGPAGGISDWLISFVLTLKVGVDTGIASREPPHYRP